MGFIKYLKSKLCNVLVESLTNGYVDDPELFSSIVRDYVELHRRHDETVETSKEITELNGDIIKCCEDTLDIARFLNADASHICYISRKININRFGDRGRCNMVHYKMNKTRLQTSPIYDTTDDEEFIDPNSLTDIYVLKYVDTGDIIMISRKLPFSEYYDGFKVVLDEDEETPKLVCMNIQTSNEVELYRWN